VCWGQQSKWRPITRKSVVQGPGIGPSAYLVYSMDLKALSSYYSILKYADDTSTLVPQHSSISIEEEFLDGDGTGTLSLYIVDNGTLSLYITVQRQ